ncbi:MAG: Nif3-like dinuclear metal center hexameric protein [Bacteroidales bacterium]|nr:Nif3-like dinuclear metal center hexameric protein [Bacteroidales bacterium]
MTIGAALSELDELFLSAYQEDYDNCGLQVGDTSLELKSILISVDATWEVLREAEDRGCNLIVSHHPLIFGGTKCISNVTEQGRIIMEAVRMGIAIYAAHTCLDNMLWGVSGELARRLGLQDIKVLRPMSQTLSKLVIFCPVNYAETVRSAVCEAGAGTMNGVAPMHCAGYDRCSFTAEGTGRFRAGADSHPFCGTPGEEHAEAEVRMEFLVEKRLCRKVVAALLKAHPYEEPAWDVLPLENSNPWVGSGAVGNLPAPVAEEDFIELLKTVSGTAVVRASSFTGRTVRKVALCGGSGSFLIGDALRQHVDVYITADLKYHDFQRAEGRLMLLDVGHFESEHYAKEVLQRIISQKNSNFATCLSQADRGYVQYL